jgi:thioredoxin reductase
LVIIGGGVAGYVAAIKAGQAGMKVREPAAEAQRSKTNAYNRLPASRSVAPSAEPA